MKKRARRLALSGAVFIAALVSTVFIPEKLSWISLTLFVAAYAIAGYKVLKKAVKNISYGKVFDENFLMTIASLGAFFIGEYPEAVAVMLFYQVGELFEDFAVGKSRKSITDLMNIRPDYANLKTDEGVERVDPDTVKTGQYIAVMPGEKIPLDGVIVEGESTIDTAALTGESLPRDVACGDEVLSGCINQQGLLIIQVSKPFGESTVNKILDMVENATMKKAKTENFITRFASVYTPIVVIAAVVLAVIPPLVVPGAEFTDWLYRALNFLVVSCPCALVISVPLSFFGGIGGASKIGVLIKGSNYLETMADAGYVIMDKTGTLTKGVFEVEGIFPEEGFSQADLLKMAAGAESYSSHPISLSLQSAYNKAYAPGAVSVSQVEEISGHGVTALVDERQVAAGNLKLMQRIGLNVPEKEGTGTVVYVAVDGKYAGSIVIADQLKEDAKDAVNGLKRRGIQTVMLTGDRKEVGEAVGAELGIDKVYAELLPGDKVDRIEEIFAEKKDGKKVVFVGDGINDAPVLARADVGIAMGGLGSDAAIEAADIVIMQDEPSKISKIIEISQNTMAIVKQNIVFALGVKILVLILSTVGYANMWMAVFADVGVSMIAILNSFRAMKVK